MAFIMSEITISGLIKQMDLVGETDHSLKVSGTGELCSIVIQFGNTFLSHWLWY